MLGTSLFRKKLENKAMVAGNVNDSKTKFNMKRTVFINNNKSKGWSFFVESLNPFTLCRKKTFDQLQEEEFAEHVKHYS